MSRLNINNTPEFGFFGKLPLNGDFIQRNLSQQFVHRWDNWLQNNLLTVQQHYGSAWTEHYLTSPIWRFYISPAIIDAHAYIGIVAPSVDRVGRYFPMTIATPVHTQQIQALFSNAVQTVFTDLESFFLQYLHAESANVEEFSAALQQHSLSLQQIIHQQHIDPLPDTLNCHRFTLSDQADIAGAVSGLWLMQMMKQHSNASLWWSNGSQSIEPSLLINSGLPNKHQFLSMLAGFDGSHHWRQNQLSVVVNEAPVPPAVAQDLAHAGEAEESLLMPSETAGYGTKIAVENTSRPEIQAAQTFPPSTMKEQSLQDQRLDLASDKASEEKIDTSDATIPNYFSRANAEADTVRPFSLDSAPKPSDFPLQSAAFCDVGNRRSQNQDAVLSHSNQSMWVVADGMGGHSAGDKASQTIVEKLSQLEFKGDLFDNLEQVKDTLNQVNQEILDFSSSEHITCGSTIVALLRSENQCAYLWAGDSRLYLQRDNQLLQLTQDHTLNNDYPDSEAPAKRKHAITRAIGVYEELDLENGFIQIEEGDHFLLCSDGLYGDLSSEQITQGLTFGSPEQAADHLKNSVLAGEARDNLSGIFVWF